MLTKLVLKNFRAFDKQSIPLSKINLFFGPNNSGKSALISAINLISQTIQSSDIDTDILLNGRFEDFGSYYEIVYGNRTSANIKIGLEAELKLPIRSYVTARHGGKLVQFKKEIQRGYTEITLGYRKQRHEIQLLNTDLRLYNNRTRIKTKRNRLGKHVIDLTTGLDMIGKKRIDSILSIRNTLPEVYPYRIMHMSDDLSQKLSLIQGFSRGLREQLTSVEFLGPFRTNPQRFYVLTGESPSHVGRHGERALEILTQDKKRKGSETKNLLGEISTWMNQAEIAEKVSIEDFTDRYFEVMVQNYYTKEYENLVDVGFGCSQIIPVLIAGFNMPQDGIFIIEEPEIHLHPRAQAELGSLFHTLYKRGIQLIIETHSEHLLLRMQSHVARGDISAKDINVFYVDPAGEKQKVIHRIPLGQDGYFTEPWPKGFFPERLKEAERLAGLIK
jgi:predicted ATPase